MQHVLIVHSIGWRTLRLEQGGYITVGGRTLADEIYPAAWVTERRTDPYDTCPGCHTAVRKINRKFIAHNNGPESCSGSHVY